MSVERPQVTATTDLRVVLFDLGGVLLRLNDPIATFGLDVSDREFKALWLALSSVRRLETGTIDIETFARAVVAEAGLPYDWREFLRRFDAWPDRLFDGALAMLSDIPQRYRRALLSNINPWHWHRETIAPPLEGMFDRTFLSYETGIVKPDAAAFRQVCDAFGCRPGKVLFLDDSPGNVEAASDFGLQAAVTDGIDAVRETLRQHGVLAGN